MVVAVVKLPHIYSQFGVGLEINALHQNASRSHANVGYMLFANDDAPIINSRAFSPVFQAEMLCACPTHFLQIANETPDDMLCFKA